MAKGYAIFSMTVHDEDAFGAYGEQAGPTVQLHSGRPVVVHDDPEVLYGQWTGQKVVILEFPSVQAARDWYHSPEYQACIGLREAAANVDVVLVERFEPPKADA